MESFVGEVVYTPNVKKIKFPAENMLNFFFSMFSADLFIYIKEKIFFDAEC